MITTLFVAAAYAGKLADGFRALPWGDASVIENPPTPQGCIPGGTPPDGTGPRWVCQVEINGVAVSVSYMLESGYFTGVHITVPPNFPAADAVHQALIAAYGTCVPRYQGDRSPLPECTWSDGTARAVWKYNEFNQATSVMIFDLGVYAKAEAVQKAKAEQAASGL